MIESIKTRGRMLAALVLGACALAAGSAWSQSDTPEARRNEAQALVKAMDELTGPERSLKLVKSAILQGMQQQIGTSQQLSAAQQQRAAEVLSEAVTEGMTEMLKEVMPGMYATMVDIYVERFTLAELQEVRRFYVSATGRKSMTVMLEDMPRVMQPMMQAMQTQAPKLQLRMEAAAAKLRGEGIELPQPKR
jgi:hypothetical protein